MYFCSPFICLLCHNSIPMSWLHRILSSVIGIQIYSDTSVFRLCITYYAIIFTCHDLAPTLILFKRRDLLVKYFNISLSSNILIFADVFIPVIYFCGSSFVGGGLYIFKDRCLALVVKDQLSFCNTHRSGHVSVSVSVSKQ